MSNGNGNENGRSLVAVPDAVPSIRVVTTARGFDALESDWNDLLERSEATVFQTYEWLRTWWKYFGGKAELRILVITIDGRIEGIAPMFLPGERFLGILVARRLQFTGIGISDYLQVIASRGNERRVVEAMASWLSSPQGEWDVFDLEDLPEHSPSFEHLPAAFAILLIYLPHDNAAGIRND